VPERSEDTLNRWLQERVVPVSTKTSEGKEIPFKRPFSGFFELTDRNRKVEPLARAIVLQNRFKNKRRFVSLPCQQHLAAVLLEVASDDAQPERGKLMVHILNALYESGYHILAVCYLLQKAADLTSSIVPRQHDPAEVIGLCEAVGSCLHDGPFGGVLKV
jgi:hypothetical protein